MHREARQLWFNITSCRARKIFLHLTLFKFPQQPFLSRVAFQPVRAPSRHTHAHTVTHRSAGTWLCGSSCWTRTTPSVRPPAAAGSGSSASWTIGSSPCCSPSSSAECRHCPDLWQKKQKHMWLQMTPLCSFRNQNNRQMGWQNKSCIHRFVFIYSFPFVGFKTTGATEMQICSLRSDDLLMQLNLTKLS